MSVIMCGLSSRERLQELFRIFLKFRQAILATEIISLSVVDVASSSALGFDVHTADGISHVVSSLIARKILRRAANTHASAPSLDS
jgi:hypothetical protein